MPVVLTIDTEPDNAWENHLDPSVANVLELLRLQELLDRYGAKATCLVTYRVIQDDRAVDVLRQLVDEGGAEIGAHLHPWETPPFMAGGEDVDYRTYPHELPLSVFEDKLNTLTEALGERFGPPSCYRGGRWSIAAEHLPVLERMGFRVDSSVTPLIDWRSTPGIPYSKHGRGGIDFRFGPSRPYHPSYTDITSEGDAQILEIPVSAAFTRRTSALVRRGYFALPTLFRCALGRFGILRPVWALPAEESGAHLARLLTVAIKERTLHFNIALHSSELMAGGSRKSRTAAKVDGIYSRTDLLLSTLTATGFCRFTTLTAACSALTRTSPAAVTTTDA